MQRTQQTIDKKGFLSHIVPPRSACLNKEAAAESR